MVLSSPGAAWRASSTSDSMSNDLEPSRNIEAERLAVDAAILHPVTADKTRRAVAYALFIAVRDIEPEAVGVTHTARAGACPASRRGKDWTYSTINRESSEADSSVCDWSWWIADRMPRVGK